MRLHRLGTFLHLLSIVLFAGTIAELLSVKHYGEPIRLVPFALCGLGLLALAAVWVRPTRGIVLVTRALMAVIAAGSLLGVYEHVRGNLEFAREVHPHASTIELLKATLTGRDPLMAPGILAVGAVIAIAATYALRAEVTQTPRIYSGRAVMAGTRFGSER